VSLEFLDFLTDSFLRPMYHPQNFSGWHRSNTGKLIA